MKKSELIILLIILLSFAVGIYLYPQMPEKMASHWNISGEVDGYAPKFWGLFLMPFVLIGFFLLFILIPKIDPFKANFEKFRKYFDAFMVFLILFFFYLHFLTLFWNLGFRFNFSQFLSPAFGMLLYCSGFLMEKTKRNWFVGIKTPWTISSERVWDKTHQVGGKLFKISGGVALLGMLFQDYAIFFTVIPVALVSLYLCVYSYFEYQEETSLPKNL